MLRILFFIAICFTVLAGHGQPIRFNKLIKLNDSLWEYGASVVGLSDNKTFCISGACINGNATDSTRFYRIFLAVADSQGMILKSTFLGENYYNYGVSLNRSNNGIITKDGGGVIACYKFDTSVSQRIGKALLIKFDASANVMWLQQYSGSWQNSASIRVLQMQDGGYMLLGSTQRMSDFEIETILVRTDSLGNVIWQKQYKALPAYIKFQPYGIVQLPDKGFVFTGTIDYINDYYIQVNRVDSSGNLMWSKRLGGPNSYADVSLLKSGNIILYGKSDWSSYLAELKPNGDTIYQLITPPSGRMDIYRHYHERQDGAVIVGMKYKDTPVQIGDHIVGWIVKLDTSKKIVWQRTFYKHNLEDNYFLSSQLTSGGGFLIVGSSVDSLATFGLADVWLVKTDSFGCDVPGCQIKDGIAPLQPEQGASFDVYPNPVSHKAGQVNVRYLLRQPNQELILTVADMNGHQLAKIPFYSYATEGSLSMDISWLNAGIYTVSLHTEMGITYQKLVVQ